MRVNWEVCTAKQSAEVFPATSVVDAGRTCNSSAQLIEDAPMHAGYAGTVHYKTICRGLSCNVRGGCKRDMEVDCRASRGCPLNVGLLGNVHCKPNCRGLSCNVRGRRRTDMQRECNISKIQKFKCFQVITRDLPAVVGSFFPCYRI